MLVIRHVLRCLICLLLVAGLSGCVTRHIAHRILHPPGGGATEVAKSVQTAPLFDAGLSVRVGPPEAVLMCLVVEPWPYAVRVGDAIGAPPPNGWRERYGEPARLPIGPSDDAVPVVIRFPDKALRGAEKAPRVTPRGTIIVLQGWGGRVSEGQYLWPTAAALADAGYRVVLPDLRGQGKSTGGHIGLGVLEARDLRQLIDELQRQGLAGETVGILGHSYGGGVAIMTAAEDSRVRAVVSLAPWHDASQAFPLNIRAAAKMYGGDTYRWFGWTLTRGALKRATRRAAAIAGVDLQEASPMRSLQRTDAPLLLIHGGEDELCPPVWSEAIRNARPEGTKLVLFDDDNHWSFLEIHWEEYRAAVVGWFNEHLAVEPR